jgi:hypothetical protein
MHEGFVMWIKQIGISDSYALARDSGRRGLRRRLAQVGRALGLCALLAATAALAQNPPPAAAKLLVSGNVENKLTLSVGDLQKLPVQRVEDVRQIRMAGAAAKDGEQTRRYTGVLLRDLLTSAKPVEKERHDLRRSIVVVTASDGYQAVFSWAELYLSHLSVKARWLFSSVTPPPFRRAKGLWRWCRSATRSPVRGT